MFDSINNQELLNFCKLKYFFSLWNLINKNFLYDCISSPFLNMCLLCGVNVQWIVLATGHIHDLDVLLNWPYGLSVVKGRFCLGSVEKYH